MGLLGSVGVAIGQSMVPTLAVAFMPSATNGRARARWARPRRELANAMSAWLGAGTCASGACGIACDAGYGDCETDLRTSAPPTAVAGLPGPAGAR
jgi:hypothetical protein